MLINSSKLINRPVHATDGDIGKITSLYFDCQQWKTRYLAVETGGVLNRKQALVPAALVRRPNLSGDHIDVNLSRDQVRNSPDVDLDLMVSRTGETDIARYYNLPMYWEAEETRGPEGEEILYIPEERKLESIGEKNVILADEPSGSTVIAQRVPGARYLFSTQEVCGYRVQAVDGEVGNVEDFILDDDSLNIRYVLADASPLNAGKKVLLSPLWIDSVNEADAGIRVDLTKESIRNAPAYEPGQPIEADYQRKLFDYYNRESVTSPFALWRFNYQRQAMANGKKLRIVVLAPAVVRWTADEWRTYSDVRTNDTGMGIYVADLDTENTSPGRSIHFTFFWPQANHWEGKNFSVKVKQVTHAGERVPEMAGTPR